MDWKVLAAVVVAAAIILSGLLSSSNILKDLGKGIPDFLSIFIPQNITRDISLSADLTGEIQSLELENAGYITILSKKPSEITVGKARIDLSKEASVNLTIENFIGKYAINFAGKSITLEGKTDKVYKDSIVVTPTESARPILITNFNMDSAKIGNTSFKRMTSKVSGDLNTNSDKMTIKLSNENIKIDNYNGDVDIAGSSVSLKGESSAIAISGKNEIEIK